MQAESEIIIETKGRGLYEFTVEVRAWVKAQTTGSGLLTIFVRHTSASLLIQENADGDVLADIESFFAALVSDDPAAYRHTTEGPDDMPSHIKSALTSTTLSIPILDGGLGLGTWQGIFLWEHRRRPNLRNILVHVGP